MHVVTYVEEYIHDCTYVCIQSIGSTAVHFRRGLFAITTLIV